MESKFENLSADIRLSIVGDDSSKLMEILTMPINGDEKYIRTLLTKEAVLLTIEFDKPQLLSRVLINPWHANFTFYQSDNGNDLDYGSVSNCCPLLYAINLKKWDCANAIAEIIQKQQLGNARNLTFKPQGFSNNIDSNEFAFFSAVKYKQYRLITLLLNSGVNIDIITFMEHAVDTKNKQLIQIGFNFNASYDKDLSKDELFASEWRIYQREKRDRQERARQEEQRKQVEQVKRQQEQLRIVEAQRIPKQRIKDLEIFLNGYKSISFTATFYKGLNMDEMVKDIQSILHSKAFSREEKLIKADKIILNHLESLVQAAKKTNSWDDFDWQTKVLGLGEVWVWGKVKYNVLNQDHIKFIDNVNGERAETQTLGTPQKKTQIAPQQFFAVKDEPKIKNNTNDEAIEDASLESFRCPITLEIMKEPTLCTLDGHTYEKEAIIQWLTAKRISPITNERMQENQTVDSVLKINRTLKNVIEEYNSKNPNSTNQMKS